MENKQTKIILDACCGPRMFWFNKKHPLAVFMDVRRQEFVACDGRKIKVNPDIIGDFRVMPFASGSFRLVVFDPPHDPYAGSGSYTAQKYGKLHTGWETDLKQGFTEYMRVLADYGILIFKWNEIRIPVSKILSIFDEYPLFGHKSGRASKTHWMCFMKIPDDLKIFM